MTDERVTALAAHAHGAPYPGLRPFGTDDAVHFFGRDQQVGELVDLLGRTGFLAVVGGAGCGKSSLIRAGLLPALYGGQFRDARPRWRVAPLRPGDDPVGALAGALAAHAGFGPAGWDDGLRAVVVETTLRRGSLGLVEAVREAGVPRDENLLVVVDQFDDIFRLAQGGHGGVEGASGFVKLLLEAVRQNDLPVYVALTLRSDYLGDCASFTGLPEAINAGHYLVPRLSRDQGREAVTGPAGVRRASVSPRLVDRVLNDLGNEPDKLPSFQHALMHTWRAWESDHEEGEPLDLRHYEEAGAVAGALAKHGEEAYAELPDDRSRELARGVFGALTEWCAGGREIRRVLRVKDLCAKTGAGEAEVTALVEFFRREGLSFLSPPVPQPLSAESLVEVSYEDVIHSWSRLKSWVGGAG